LGLGRALASLLGLGLGLSLGLGFGLVRFGFVKNLLYFADERATGTVAVLRGCTWVFFAVSVIVTTITDAVI
jgi:hypothetical protein